MAPSIWFLRRSSRAEEVDGKLFEVLESVLEAFSRAEMVPEDKLMRRIFRRCIMMCCWRLTGWRLKVYLARAGLDDRSWQVVIFD